MMRVCIVSDGLPFDHGGAQLRAYRHSQHLQMVEGIETILVVWDQSTKEIKDFTLPAYAHPVKLRFQEVGGTQNVIQFIKFILHLAELFIRIVALLFGLRQKFDVLHIINAASWFSLFTVPIAKALNKQVIIEMVSLGGDDPLKLNRRSNNPEQQIFHHRPIKYSLFLKADAYVSKSLALSEAYLQAGLPEAKLFRIPSGVDTGKFKPPTPQEKQAIRLKLRLDEDPIIILFVGLINEYKGVSRLLSAFRKITPYYQKTLLLIVGPSRPSDTAYLLAIKQDIAAWDLFERVILVDEMVHNVDDYMKAADVFALPTSREGLSVAILEAMSTGLAIVASDIPEIALSQIKHEVEGLLVPVGDTNKLADAILKLINDNKLRARLGQAARQRVLQEFTYEIVYDQYLRLYEQILKYRPLEPQYSN